MLLLFNEILLGHTLCSSTKPEGLKLRLIPTYFRSFFVQARTGFLGVAFGKSIHFFLKLVDERYQLR